MLLFFQYVASVPWDSHITVYAVVYLQNCIILQPANDKYSPIIINEYNYHEFKIIGKLALVISKRN